MCTTHVVTIVQMRNATSIGNTLRSDVDGDAEARARP